jgi:limonene-1,2-epoxide hydrolase
MSPLLTTFCDFYRHLSLESLELIDAIYDQNVELQDPVHRITGLPAVKHYFNTMLANTGYCRFLIEQAIEQNGEAFVSWQMSYVHRNIGNGQAIQVSGVSHIKYNQRVHYHRDYFDLGEMVYEQLPLLGTAVRAVKKRMAR